jgi:hypothetical protein
VTSTIAAKGGADGAKGVQADNKSAKKSTRPDGEPDGDYEKPEASCRANLFPSRAEILSMFLACPTALRWAFSIARKWVPEHSALHAIQYSRFYLLDVQTRTIYPVERY